MCAFIYNNENTKYSNIHNYWAERCAGYLGRWDGAEGGEGKKERNFCNIIRSKVQSKVKLSGCLKVRMMSLSSLEAE